MTNPLRSDPAKILRFLQVVYGPGEVREIRVLQVRNGNYTENRVGFFDADHLEDAAQAIARILEAGGVYFTLNPVNPGLHARAFNRIKKAEKNGATSDAEIVHRRWMLVDVDAKRPAGISATDAEKEAAWDVAQKVRAWLSSEGWPAPVVVDSGNGFHLLYRIVLPADDGGLIGRDLVVLDQKFGTDVVKIDSVNGNAGRISKIAGTPVCKGDSTPDRPHRMSRLLEVPDDLQSVPVALLEALAGPVKAAEPEKKVKGASGTAALDAWLTAHGLTDGLSDWEAWQDGQRRVWDVCPMNSEHTNRSAMLYLGNDGKRGFRCHHDGCKDHHWGDLRAKYDPPSDVNGWYEEAPGPAPWPEEATESTARQPLINFLVSGPELMCLKATPREHIVEPFISTSSINMVAAERGIGKTFFVDELAKAVGTGTPFFEWHVPMRRNVVLIDGEMPTEMIQERMGFLCGGSIPDEISVLPSESLWTKDKPLNLNEAESQGRIKQLLDDLTAQGRKPALVIIDNLSSLSFGLDENDNTMQDTILRWLMGLRHQGYAVLLVHHAGKNGQQRGASRREDFLDTSIMLTKSESAQAEGAAFKISFSKERGRKAVPNTLEVALEHGIHGEAVWTRIKAIPEYMNALLLIHEHHPKDYTALSKLMDITRTAATNHVKRLREKGLIQPLDLGITRKGIQALARLSNPEAA